MARKGGSIQEVVIKIIILGDSSVGKSCFLMRYCENIFDPVATKITIGMDFQIKKETIDGYIVKMFIWDTAGQEKFRAITKNYYKGAHVIFLLYDVSNRESFENLKKWMATIKDEASAQVPKILIGNKVDLVEKASAETLISSETFISREAIDHGSLFDDISLSTVSFESSDSLGSISKDSLVSRSSFSSFHKEKKDFVSLQEGTSFAFENGFDMFFVTSAATGENVKIAFQNGCKEGLKYVITQQAVTPNSPNSPSASPKFFNRWRSSTSLGLTPPASPASPLSSLRIRKIEGTDSEKYGNQIVLKSPPLSKRHLVISTATVPSSEITSDVTLSPKRALSSPLTPRTPTTPTPTTPTTETRISSASKVQRPKPSEVIRLTEFPSSKSNVAPECCSV